jgi:hypothetical protein
MNAMDVWIKEPEIMARRLRTRKAIEKALRERDVDVQKFIGTAGRFFVRGQIHLTLGGLMDIWRQLFPGELIPEYREGVR